MKTFFLVFTFSILLFSSSLLFFPCLHSFFLHFSATFHKNYVFLLCNGILVFIVRNSGISCSSSADADHGGELVEIEHESREKRQGALALDIREVEVESKVINGFSVEEDEDEDEDEDEKKELAMAEEEKGFSTKENEELAMAEEEDEEEEEESSEMLSTEELNRKCDDFIRRVKDEMRFESNQLIIVYQ